MATVSMDVVWRGTAFTGRTVSDTYAGTLDIVYRGTPFLEGPASAATAPPGPTNSPYYYALSQGLR